MSVQTIILSLFLFIAFILSLIAIVIYLYKLWHIDLNKGIKVVWFVAFFLFPNIAEIVFWIKYINTEKI